MKAIQKLIGRVLGEAWINQFEIILENNNTATEYFELQTRRGKVQVRASGTLAAISGVYWYMKHYLNMHLSWCGNHKVIPEVWPILEEKVYKETPYTYKYYLNYCTYGYSMAFWEWDRWEQELDWMAMNGINLMLSLVGHEEVWRQTLIELGYTNEEAKAFICGPTFMPWQWMQNIEGWGSNHTDEWFERRVALAHKIHNRMKELGITPAMQGYSGMIPTNFKEKCKGAEVLEQGNWCHLTRPDLLIPGSNVFNQVAEIFYRKQREIFGVESAFYCTDPFHEGGNREGLDIGTCIQHIQAKMIENNPDAIWVIQGWGENPNKETLEALNPKHTLILDLWCEAHPTWKSKQAFNGIPWIWCILGNFGGKNGLYGNLKATATGHLEAYHDEASGNMMGIGMTMEGIHNNPIVWDLLCDTSWEREAICLEEWLKGYLARRYGQCLESSYKAWQLLKESIYNCTRRQEGGVESIFCGRPSLEITSVSTWGPQSSYYEREDVVEACRLLLKDYKVLQSAQGYLYDLVDITRQILADLGKVQYHKWVKAFKEKDLVSFKVESKRFLEMLNDMECLLGAHKEFLLGPYLEQAKALGKTLEEKTYLEWNARTIITLWANQEGSKLLRDYSHRQWAGLTEAFYTKRWTIYFEALEVALEANQEVRDIDWYSIEQEWVAGQELYKVEVEGEINTIVKEILDKYFK